MTETFKAMTIKEVFTNADCKAILDRMAPQLTNLSVINHFLPWFIPSVR